MAGLSFLHPMSATQQPLEFTLDWYRHRAKSDPHTAMLVGMINRQRNALIAALDEVVRLSREIKAIKEGRP